MKKFKSITAIALAFSFATATIVSQPIQPLTTVQAATKLKLNRTNATIKVGKTVQLKVKGTKKKVKWSSSNVRIAKVSSKGKVTGKKVGNAKITAKVSGKKLTCKIKVVKSTSTQKPTTTPNTPDQTATPTPDSGKQVSLNLDFYLDDYNPSAPNEQFVNVYFANHLNESVFVETEAYVTTRGENYPALISNTKLGEKKEIKPTYPEDTYGERVVYDSLDYVLNGSDCTMWWLPLDENSTLTFFFRIGEKRYKAIISYNQKGSIYREATDYEQLEPFMSVAPSETKTPYETKAPADTVAPIETKTPSETEEPIETVAPSETEKPIETTAPSAEPTTTPEPKKLEDLNLEFYLEPYDPNQPQTLWVYVDYTCSAKTTVLIEKNGYLTTNGKNYPLELADIFENDTIEPDQTSIDTGVPLHFDSVGLTLMPIDENTTLTFFFRTDGKRYKATINYNPNDGIYYEVDDTEQL